MGIKIEIDITEMGLVQDPETGDVYPNDDLQQSIIEQIARRVSMRDETALRNRIDSLIETIIREEVKPIVAGFLAQPIQKHDKYSGQPVGEPTTIADLTMQSVEKFLTAPARDGINRAANNLGELVADSVKAILERDLKPTIEAAKKELRETVITRALEGAVAALTPHIR